MLGNFDIFVENDLRRSSETLDLGHRAGYDSHVGREQTVAVPVRGHFSNFGKVPFISGKGGLHEFLDEIGIALHVGDVLPAAYLIALVQLRKSPLASPGEILESVAAPCKGIGEVVVPVKGLLFENRIDILIVHEFFFVDLRKESAVFLEGLGLRSHVLFEIILF